MNKIILKGRLTKDVEVTETKSKKKVAVFDLAVARPFSKDETDFFRCIAWEKTGEFVSKYFTKGQEMLLTGSVQFREYEDKNKVKRQITEVIVSEVEFSGNKNDAKEVKEELPFG